MLESLHTMPGLSRSVQPMTFPRKNNHHGRLFEILQRSKQLLAARVRWRQMVVLSFNEHHWGMDFLDEGNGRTSSIGVPILEWRRLEPYWRKPREICGVPPCLPIGNITRRHRRRK